MIEFGDGGDARLTSNQIGPALGNRVSDRRHKAKPSDDDATTAHYDFLRVREAEPERRPAPAMTALRQATPVTARHIRLCFFEQTKATENSADDPAAGPPVFCGSESRYDRLRP
ncbi:hypothetical protein [Cupriavidus sp. WS]|uniref:hypothetical protein n=1 Tax=Cupriavidus sp. WS TaxID=1312922 RepID=UPI001E479482|nr:hypothetical protein [Cupriavidus sp. WS]